MVSIKVDLVYRGYYLQQPRNLTIREEVAVSDRILPGLVLSYDNFGVVVALTIKVNIK